MSDTGMRSLMGAQRQTSDGYGEGLCVYGCVWRVGLQGGVVGRRDVVWCSRANHNNIKRQEEDTHSPCYAPQYTPITHQHITATHQIHTNAQ